MMMRSVIVLSFALAGFGSVSAKDVVNPALLTHAWSAQWIAHPGSQKIQLPPAAGEKTESK